MLNSYWMGYYIPYNPTMTVSMEEMVCFQTSKYNWLLLLLLTRRLAWYLVQKLQGHVTHTKKTTCLVDRERNTRVSSAIATIANKYVFKCRLNNKKAKCHKYWQQAGRRQVRSLLTVCDIDIFMFLSIVLYASTYLGNELMSLVLS